MTKISGSGINIMIHDHDKDKWKWNRHHDDDDHHDRDNFKLTVRLISEKDRHIPDFTVKAAEKLNT